MSQQISVKPLAFYANLSVVLETPNLTQHELRKLIKRLLSANHAPPSWCFSWEKICWIDHNWQILIEDRAGVVKWASQHLLNEGENS